MLKVCHLTSAHPAFDIRIFYKECRTLADSGYSVVLIAQNDKNQVVEGVTIKALQKPKNRLERMTGAFGQIYRAALKEKAAVYHFHDPELIATGFLLKLRGKKVIYDIHEDYPEALLSREWIPFWLRAVVSKMVRGIEWLAARSFDALVAATPTIANRFPPAKTKIVQNFPVLSESNLREIRLYQERPRRIVYIGGLSILRGAEEMIRAMECLPDNLEAELILAGRFSPPSLEDSLIKLRGWRKTQFLGWLSQSEIASLLQDSRVGLVVLHPVLSYIQSQPIKLFEYCSAGIPVIASDFPLWKALITENRCGLVVDPLDPEAIANAIRWLLENPSEAEAMGRRGREAFLERYNWNGEARELLSVYKHILE